MRSTGPRMTVPLGVRQSPVRQGRHGLTGIAFAANGDLWVAGSTPDAVYRSQDDGATWGSAITGPAGQTTLEISALNRALSRRPHPSLTTPATPSAARSARPSPTSPSRRRTASLRRPTRRAAFPGPRVQHHHPRPERHADGGRLRHHHRQRGDEQRGHGRLDGRLRLRGCHAHRPGHHSGGPARPAARRPSRRKRQQRLLPHSQTTLATRNPLSMVHGQSATAITRSLPELRPPPAHRPPDVCSRRRLAVRGFRSALRGTGPFRHADRSRHRHHRIRAAKKARTIGRSTRSRKTAPAC